MDIKNLKDVVDRELKSKHAIKAIHKIKISYINIIYYSYLLLIKKKTLRPTYKIFHSSFPTYGKKSTTHEPTRKHYVK